MATQLERRIAALEARHDEGSVVVVLIDIRVNGPDVPARADVGGVALVQQPGEVDAEFHERVRMAVASNCRAGENKVGVLLHNDAAPPVEMACSKWIGG